MCALAIGRQTAFATASWTQRAISVIRGRSAPQPTPHLALRSSFGTTSRKSDSLLFNVWQSKHVLSRQRGFATSASMVDSVREKNGENPVIVYSKTWCPYCSQVKELFQQLSIQAKIVELDEVIEGDEVQAALYDVSGSRTVPQVFIGGTFVGGGDDVMMMEHSGELQEKLLTVGIEVKK